MKPLVRQHPSIAPGVALVALALSLIASPPAIAGHATTRRVGSDEQATKKLTKAELLAYLRKMHVKEARFQTIFKRASAAVAASVPVADEVDAGGDPSLLNPVATRLRNAQNNFETLAIQTAAIRAPLSLRAAHSRMVKAFQLLSSVFRTFANAIQSVADTGDTSGLDFAVSKSRPASTQAADARSDWKVAVSAVCLRVGVSIPAWVSNIGR